MIKSNPVHACWATHKLEKIIPQKFYRSENPEPHVRLPSLRVWQ